MKITVGFSPCPNDTFIFDALVNGRIDTEGLEIDYFLADVEELNRRAFSSGPDITKISTHAYTYIAREYLILDSGGAVGYGSGPLLICKDRERNVDLNKSRIAIPGRLTTANLLFSIAWPEAVNKREYLFSEIEDVLLREEADAGLIIHESRFTYQRKGLFKIADMGEYWEKLTGLPVPLGIIVVNRRIPEDIALKFNRILRKSVEYAKANAVESYDFVVSNAKEMESNVLNSHIELYVNEFSLNLGYEGKKALSELFALAHRNGIIPAVPEHIFLTGSQV